jgi:hypothetical protein
VPSTGERIDGRKYRAICQAAVNGATINAIAQQVGVKWETAKVIVERESKPIGERKRELADACMRIAQHATERIEDNLHEAPLQSLPTIVGIMTDKVVALTSDPQIQQNLHIHLNAVDLIGSFNNMLSKIQNSTSPAFDSPIHSTDARSATTKSPTALEQESCYTVPTCSEKTTENQNQNQNQMLLLTKDSPIKKTDSTQSQLDGSTPEPHQAD